MLSKLEDHRRFPRVKVQAALHYQVRGKPDFSNSIADNISLGGLRFSDHSFIAPETILMLEVNVLSRVLNPIARIAWSHPISHADKFQFGVEFIEFEHSQKKYLQDFVAMQMQQV